MISEASRGNVSLKKKRQIFLSFLILLTQKMYVIFPNLFSPIQRTNPLKTSGGKLFSRKNTPLVKFEEKNPCEQSKFPLPSVLSLPDSLQSPLYTKSTLETRKSSYSVQTHLQFGKSLNVPPIFRVRCIYFVECYFFIFLIIFFSRVFIYIPQSTKNLNKTKPNVLICNNFYLLLSLNVLSFHLTIRLCFHDIAIYPVTCK